LKGRADSGPPAHVGPLLKEFLGSRPAFAADPIGDWSELVGEQVARHTRPKSLKKKVLVIAAHDSVWKHHLEQYKEVLAERINGGRAETLVEQIVIRVGEIPESAPALNPANNSLEKIKAKKAERGKKRKLSQETNPEEQKLLKSLPTRTLRVLEQTPETLPWKINSER